MDLPAGGEGLPGLGDLDEQVGAVAQPEGAALEVFGERAFRSVAEVAWSGQRALFDRSISRSMSWLRHVSVCWPRLLVITTNSSGCMEIAIPMSTSSRARPGVETRPVRREGDLLEQGGTAHGGALLGQWWWAAASRVTRGGTVAAANRPPQQLLTPCIVGKRDRAVALPRQHAASLILNEENP